MDNTYRTNQYYVDAYNTRTGVPDDVNALFETWASTSTTARESHPCEIALAYGDAHRETIDLFFTENSKRWVVFIHGGYWRMKAITSGHFHYLAPALLDAGYNVAFPEYDVCPDVSLYTIVEQVRRSIAWLANNYSDQCEEIIITGHSAGGHLTGMMFATDWQSYGMSPDLITGGIALSSLFDLDPIAQTAMNADLQLTVPDVQALSPARLLPLVDAPLVLTAGAMESAEFQRQNTILHGIPEWQAITSDPLSLENIHHFNIPDLLMDQNGILWQTLYRLQAK